MQFQIADNYIQNEKLVSRDQTNATKLYWILYYRLALNINENLSAFTTELNQEKIKLDTEFNQIKAKILMIFHKFL